MCPKKLIKNVDIPIVFIHGFKDVSIPIQKGINVYDNSNKERSLFLKIETSHYFKDRMSYRKLCTSVKTALCFLTNKLKSTKESKT
ncbi:MAG: hypothetical protein Q8O66_02590 [bacterium]|nr:hypothetical protein [bacterium]